MVLIHATGDTRYYSDYLRLVRCSRQPRAQFLAASTMVDLGFGSGRRLMIGVARVEIVWAKSSSSANQRAQFAIKDEHVLIGVLFSLRRGLLVKAVRPLRRLI